MLARVIRNPLLWVFIFVSSIAVAAISNNAASDTSREYHLKAAFLRYVAKFVTWPENSLPDDIINICLYGEVPSMKGLNSINGREVEGRSLLVRPIKTLDDAEQQCQILFVTESAYSQSKTIIDNFKAKPVLTFGDLEGFAEQGGAMNFYVVNNRMAIMINQETVAESKLSIHPRMMKLVTIVPDIDEDSSNDAA